MPFSGAKVIIASPNADFRSQIHKMLVAMRWPAEEAMGGNCGNSFFGTKGFYVRSKGFFSYKENKGGDRDPIPVPADLPVRKEDKWQRWFAAIRGRCPVHWRMVPANVGNKLYTRSPSPIATDPDLDFPCTLITTPPEGSDGPQIH